MPGSPECSDIIIVPRGLGKSSSVSEMVNDAVGAIGASGLDLDLTETEQGKDLYNVVSSKPVLV